MTNAHMTTAKQRAAARLDVMTRQRPGSSLVVDRVMARAVEVYGDHHPSSAELLPRRKMLEELLRSDIPDVTVRHGHKKSLSKNKNRNAAGLMLYEPRPYKVDKRTLIGAYSYTVVLKPSELWLLSSIEPAMTQSHLYERIFERSGNFDIGIAEIQEQLSDIWIPLLWMRSRRVLAGRGFIPHEFMTPWNDGLFFGRVEKVQVGAAKPLVHVVTSSKGTQRYPLPDFYGDGENRISAFTNTFVDATNLKPHQITLRDRLVDFVSSHRQVINHLKLTWMVAADSENPFTHEIMDIFGFESPPAAYLDATLLEMESIVDCEEWRREAEYSARSRARHQADAVVRTVASVGDSAP
jgi:hypothetical protein